MNWRFLQISDPHLGSEDDGRWNNGFICTMMPDVMRCLRKDLTSLKPDFILATGDISSHQTRDSMFAARDLMDSLGYPYYPMGGNHDFVVEQSREWFIEAFHAQLPIKRTYYSFSHNGLHFCVLDPWWLWEDDTLSPISELAMAEKQKKDVTGARWAVPDDQLLWLEEDIKKHADMPVIVSSHYPAIDVPERLKRPEMKIGGHLENGQELCALLNRYSNVKALFAGHLHMHIIEKDTNFTHVITGSLPEYPTEYRDIHVYKDKLEIHTLGLSDPSFSARSLIPGNDWTKGQLGDRKAIISLD
ncbi:MAG: hypothetical protein COA73_03010 [Candidatus Hydrogenedentota bacterium]|nr:MAG: hypothetical protein COA73_03010 [Candidatus Hydrogenedentota bacterium]